MDIKWIGAILIISASGSFGFMLSAAHYREEKYIKSLINALDFMVSELHFHAASLPELCRKTAGESIREIGGIFFRLGEELDRNINPNVSCCMESVLVNTDLPPLVTESFNLLGRSLGKFDLEGQLQDLESVRHSCRQALKQLTDNRELRLRNYHTLSLCAGAALAILLV